MAAECLELGSDALVCQADVSDGEDCKRLVKETLSKWGRLDALVNNAGTTKFVNHADLAGRTCTPESVAESILSFVDGHSIITGEHIVLDGGALLM